MTGKLLVVLAVLMAGCLSDSPSAPTPSPVGTCDGGPIACGGIRSVRLEDCIEAAYTIELPTQVYSLPANFSDNPTATSQQLLSVVFAHCATMAAGNQSWSDVSIGYTGVRIQPPDGGPAGDIAVFDLEAITDSPVLAAFLGATGAPVLNASVAIQDGGGRRTGTVLGDVDYAFNGLYAPVDGQTFGFKEAHFSEAGSYLGNSDCAYYEGTAPMATLASKGRLTEAGPSAAAGQGGQPQTCTIVLSLQ